MSNRKSLVYHLCRIKSSLIKFGTGNVSHFNMTRILIVDSDRNRNSFIRDFFEKKNKKIESAYSGFESFYFCHKRSFDIIFISFELPDFSGKRIAVNLLNNNVNGFIIMITNKAKISQQIFCNKNKIGLLTNPVTNEALSGIMKEYKI
jgi:DNA-binding response OmpR family regulator